MQVNMCAHVNWHLFKPDVYVHVYRSHPYIPRLSSLNQLSIQLYEHDGYTLYKVQQKRDTLSTDGHTSILRFQFYLSEALYSQGHTTGYHGGPVSGHCVHKGR